MLTINEMREAIATLAEKYGVAKVDLFGSYANGTANENSDADFLVKFNAETPSIFKVMGFKAELITALNRNVDVITLPLDRPDKINIDKVVAIYERA